MKEKVVENRKDLLSRFIDAILSEMGEDLIKIYNILTKNINECLIENTICWDPVAFISKTKFGLKSHIWNRIWHYKYAKKVLIYIVILCHK